MYLQKNWGTLKITAPFCNMYSNFQKVGIGTYSQRVKSGTYKIKIERDHYKTIEKEEYVGRGDVKELNYKLEPIMGSLSVLCEPTESYGAEIYLNDENTGKVTPSVLPLIIGDYKLGLKHPNYHEATQNVKVIENENTKLRVQMEPYNGSVSGKGIFRKKNNNSTVDLFDSQDKNSPQINNINFTLNHDLVEITYDLVNYKPMDNFSVKITAYKQNGDPLNINSISGDISDLKGSIISKRVFWDVKRDGDVLKDKIFFIVSATKNLRIPLETHLIKSLIFPGWGDLKLRNGKTAIIYGLGGFACIAGSILLNQQAVLSYSSYKNSYDLTKSNQLFKDAVLKRNLSYAFAISAAMVWTIDLAGIYNKRNKLNKGLSEENSRYYFKKAQQKITGISKLQQINN